MAVTRKKKGRRGGRLQPRGWYVAGDCVLLERRNKNGGIVSEFIAFAIDNRRNPEFSKKNLKLLAAAPRLLEACKQVAKQASMGVDVENPDDWSYAEITRSVIDEVVNAIDAAE